METRKIADWLQIVGNLGIFIGLFFVGFQLYQDRQLKEAELAAGYFENRILANVGTMGDKPYESIVKAATNPDAMTPEDAYIFFANLDNWMMLWMRSARMTEYSLGREDWYEWAGMTLEASTPMGVREVKRFLSGPGNLLPKEFVQKLREQLEEPDRELGFQKRLEQLLGRPVIVSEENDN